MPATSLNDYEVIAPIGAGSYGNCKKIRRKKDGKVSTVRSQYVKFDGFVLLSINY